MKERLSTLVAGVSQDREFLLQVSMFVNSGCQLGVYLLFLCNFLLDLRQLSSAGFNKFLSRLLEKYIKLLSTLKLSRLATLQYLVYCLFAALGPFRYFIYFSHHHPPVNRQASGCPAYFYFEFSFKADIKLNVLQVLAFDLQHRELLVGLLQKSLLGLA